jgi:triacylglycerol lipase
MNHQRVTTKYPILLVYGLFGLDRVGCAMFKGVVDALEQLGCRVYVPGLAGVYDNEGRGELLLERIERFMKRTGYLKVNLIGHGQGALSCRYAAALRPDRVASVTSVNGPNHGSEVIDLVRQAFIPGELPEAQATRLVAGYSHFIRLLDPDSNASPGPLYALRELSTYSVAQFNRRFPQGLPPDWGGEGSERVEGVHYYSWSGCIQHPPPGEEQNPLDPLHLALRSYALLFERETLFNDGLVGRYSSHFGKVIRSDYPMDHVAAIHQTAEVMDKSIDPVKLYVDHAALLSSKGL